MSDTTLGFYSWKTRISYKNFSHVKKKKDYRHSWHLCSVPPLMILQLFVSSPAIFFLFIHFSIFLAPFFLVTLFRPFYKLDCIIFSQHCKVASRCLRSNFCAADNLDYRYTSINAVNFNNDENRTNESQRFYFLMLDRTIAD